MIDLYSAPTVNGYRAAVALEEAGLPWRYHKINFRTDDQKKPEFLSINPYGKIPVLVDPEGLGHGPVTLAQSGAILVYAAEKSGRLLAKDPMRRAIMWQWFMQAMTDVQAASSCIFLNQSKTPVIDDRNVAFFEGRMVNFLRNCDAHLKDREFVADELTIADLSLYVLVSWRSELIERSSGLDNVRRWAAGIGARPSIEKAYSTVI